MRQGNVTRRPGLKILLKVMGKGDGLVIDHPKSLGAKPAYRDRNAARIEARGVENVELTEEGRQMRPL